MKKIIVFLLIITLPLLSACTLADNGQLTVDEIITVDEAGNTTFNQGSLQAALNNFDYLDLTDIEKQGILYMIEEEKLAHDVYASLYDKWGVNVFNNISSSEQTHTNAVQSLATRYGIDIPENVNKLGEYQNSDLQELYDNLVAQGSESLDNALEVGAAIEEIDILDLQEYISQTDKEDIIMVYENLMKGSRNHLRSFVRNMGEYSPQYLDSSEYNDIVSSEVERGGNGQGNRGRGQNGGR